MTRFINASALLALASALPDVPYATNRNPYAGSGHLRRDSDAKRAAGSKRARRSDRRRSIEKATRKAQRRSR